MQRNDSRVSLISEYKGLESPCFILDVEELEKSIKDYYNALKANFANAIVGYSVKTNSVPYCLSKAREYGVYAEVVSSDEYELATLCGFTPDRIIYNGPMKSRETFIDNVVGGG